MKLYTDASKGEGVFGLGYVINLKTGGRIEGKHYVEGDYTSMEAEWHGLMQGLEVAQEQVTAYDDTIRVVVDCQPLVDKIRDPDDMYDDKWFEYRRLALRKLFEFEEWELEWEERSTTEQNKTANRLAREALWQGRDDNGVEGGNATNGITFNDTT
ncbi:RNAse HI [Halogranum tailed virus 1]|uniref:RNAse HI n=1 Tax=Halogranum tailed virus 1 TaxID=1273749 RepID=R4TL91_9CAUD|nr:RNAse HI [Halogranum tailed virus 1]AGM11442.1 RNAse HI [Halogranum tailed virus 1]